MLFTWAHAQRKEIDSQTLSLLMSDGLNCSVSLIDSSPKSPADGSSFSAPSECSSQLLGGHLSRENPFICGLSLRMHSTCYA